MFSTVPPTFYIEGEVSDETGRYLPNVEVTLVEALTQEETTVRTGPDGRFKFAAKPGSDYTVRASQTNHLSQSHPLSTRGLLRSDTLRAALELPTVVIDAPIAGRRRAPV